MSDVRKERGDPNFSEIILRGKYLLFRVNLVFAAFSWKIRGKNVVIVNGKVLNQVIDRVYKKYFSKLLVVGGNRKTSEAERKKNTRAFKRFTITVIQIYRTDLHLLFSSWHAYSMYLCTSRIFRRTYLSSTRHTNWQSVGACGPSVSFTPAKLFETNCTYDVVMTIYKWKC